MKSLVFHVLEDGSLDCHHAEEGGPTYSFDPAQLPANLKALLPKALTAALVAKVAAETKASEAEDRAKTAETNYEEVAHLTGIAEQLAAKDANIQELLERLSAVEPEVAARMEENIVLRHEVLTLRAKELGVEPPPPLEEWRKEFEAPIEDPLDASD